VRRVSQLSRAEVIQLKGLIQRDSLSSYALIWRESSVILLLAEVRSLGKAEAFFRDSQRIISEGLRLRRRERAGAKPEGDSYQEKNRIDLEY